MSMMRTLAATLLALSVAGPAYAEGPANAQVPDKVVASANAPATNVVLVHGGTTHVVDLDKPELFVREIDSFFQGK
ncbi:hypothetical protein [Afifella sp. IM 167]|uniref:hypothetical protein n=1 Tax=Afifella sp. IM 167 TaxID=2033586 RepID=UPI001CCF9EAE|nr:hypothetical protein [Afifella sp. IM 167]MBZ8131950.1 hypothetical protein [Afifella sp. IM 167]